MPLDRSVGERGVNPGRSRVGSGKQPHSGVVGVQPAGRVVRKQQKVPGSFSCRVKMNLEPYFASFLA